MSLKDKQWCLKYLYALLQCPICKRISLKNLDLIDPSFYNLSVDSILNFIDKHNNKSFLLAIYFRTAYGGLKGDIRMLTMLTSYYLNYESLVSLSLVENMDFLKESKFHILPAAADFHVDSSILDYLESKTHLPSELLKTIIWQCSSGYNNRHPYQYQNNKYLQAWQKLEPLYNNRANYFIQTLL